jgi:hypothetical protein
MFGHVGRCWCLINLSGGIFRAGARNLPPVILILGKRRSRVTLRPSTEVRCGCSAGPHRNRLTGKAPPANYAPPSIGLTNYLINEVNPMIHIGSSVAIGRQGPTHQQEECQATTASTSRTSRLLTVDADR